MKTELDECRQGCKIIEAFNEKGYFDMDNLTTNTKAGRSKWTVIVDIKSEDERDVIEQMKKDTQNLQRQMNWMSDITAVPHMRNCAAQILLFLIGEQPLVPTPTGSKYASMKPGDRYDQVLSSVVADADFTLSKGRLTAICDPLVTRRNNTKHCASISQLDSVVADAATAFDAWPALMKTCKDEYDVISNYKSFKAKFSSSTPP
jgi:hypothetical protein